MKARILRWGAIGTGLIFAIGLGGCSIAQLVAGGVAAAALSGGNLTNLTGM